MIEDSKVVTVPTETPDITDRFEVETNVVPESAEPAKPVKDEQKVEPSKNKTTEVKTPDTEPKEPTEPKPINPRTAQRKAEKERLLRDNATMAERIRQMEQERSPPKAEPKAKDLSKEPDIQDYDDVLEYNRDVARYDATQTFQQETSKLAMQKQMDSLAERAEVVRAEKPDFDEKVGSLIQSQLVTPDIEKAILASPIGADIGYHLANYGSDLMTLRGLPPEALPQAIKAIEAFIKNGSKQEKPKVTKATPPITPPGMTINADRPLNAYSQEELEDMPIAQYKRLSNMK